MIYKDITLIIGPTAVGKSDYAIKLALETGAEIISADAYQIYKGLDIGSAKISKDEQSRVKHHLIDIKEAHESYTVSNFIDESRDIIGQLRKKNTPIIICGGTGLYIQCFLYGYSLAPENQDIRKQLESEAKDIGQKALWDKLYTIPTKIHAVSFVL
jgi:tRNA dimethylallyltransferase